MHAYGPMLRPPLRNIGNLGSPRSRAGKAQCAAQSPGAGSRPVTSHPTQEPDHESKPGNTKGQKNNKSADETIDEEIHARSKAKKQTVSKDKRWTKISNVEQKSD